MRENISVELYNPSLAHMKRDTTLDNLEKPYRGCWDNSSHRADDIYL